MGVIDFIYDAINKNQNQGMVQPMQQPMDMMGAMPNSSPYDMDMMGVAPNFNSYDMNTMGMQQPLGYQQPMMQPQNYMMMSPQMQQNAYANYSTPGYGCDIFGNKVHYSKAEIMEGLKYYILSNTGVQVTQIVKLEDVSQYIKHACVNGKVQNLPQNIYHLPDVGITFPFWFCMYCGKLIIEKDAF